MPYAEPYGLADGKDTPRQLIDASGDVLTYTHAIDGLSMVSVYTYDAAHELADDFDSPR